MSDAVKRFVFDIFRRADKCLMPGKKNISEKKHMNISFDVINWKKNKFKESLHDLKMSEKFLKISEKFQKKIKIFVHFF